MGTLIYGTGAKYDFDDRVLAHLKIAITSKLRMHESFLVSWSLSAEQGSGRVSLWFAPPIPAQYLFDTARPPVLNRVWIEAMIASASSPRGMVVLAESEAAAVASKLA